MDKPQAGNETVDQYISRFDPEIQFVMQQVRRTILDAAPQATEVISWKMPTFRMKKILVHFAGYTHHLGFYPGPETIEAFKGRLSGYKTSKGTVQFKYDIPVPLELISDMVNFRLKMLAEGKD